jgi:drug/metabolite transporter (DMT)-like permease
LAVVEGEGFPQVGTVVLAALAGMAGVVGLVNLYHGLAVGRMAVVAPVTGLLAAILPVTAGILIDGFPAITVTVGITVALVAVVLVSRTPADDGAQSGLRFGLAAGLGFGLFNILISRVPEAQLFGSLAVAKMAAAVLVGLVIVGRRSVWRVGAPALPAVLAIGVLDMAANALFVLAAHAGRLDVAAILSSLYPVVTVILAATLLRERIAQTHLIGIALAIIAIALIASGSRSG